MHYRMLFTVLIVGSIAFSSHRKPAAYHAAALTHQPTSVEAGCTTYYDSVVKQKVYTNVEIGPEYRGGSGAWQRFLNKNLRIPDGVIDEEVQSSVFTNCIISKEGKLLDIRIEHK